MNVANAAVAADGDVGARDGRGRQRRLRFPRRTAGEARPAQDASTAIWRSASARKACWSASDAADGYLPVEAHIIEPLGAYDIVDLKVGSQMLRARTKSGYVKAAGDRVFATHRPAQAHFFDTASGNSLGVRL